ncbi:glycosyltransferase [Flavobacterium sufflavum]|uniref:Glycosyltransferase n=1 Tax=Flavobacterium sufflavum TaxID=1921138 RepID=A0A437KUI9_9FLAO|nr:glycosyltransferase [Flavobacterium sufflavum]RVT75846.1 glycosyltransferase [Flavobacterium sufflavum]
MAISAFLPVYNEEKRIKDTLESLIWCDEIILVDKNSSDRTVEIAKSFGKKVKVFFMNNSLAYDSSEWNVFLDNCSCEWTILFTASDVIHPKLVEKITELIDKKDFNYDIINIPFRRYILGLESKRSPWYSELSPKIVKKSSIIIDKTGVHNAAQFIGNCFNLKNSDEFSMYHLTHETVDIMMERHIRYWRGEANNNEVSLNKSAITVLKEFVKIIFIRKTFLMGKNGIMLMFAYLSYYMMAYVYKWEKSQGNSSNEYMRIRSVILNDWKSTNKS